MKCEQCGKEHDGSFGSGRFCSRSCSNKWVALHQSEEAKARKVEKGRKNLLPPSYNNFSSMSSEQRLDACKKGALASAESKRERRKEWLGKILRGEIQEDVYRASYSRFREYLVEFGYKDSKCESCGLSEWLGQPIPLELHHRDADGMNNRLENLVMLCPNCHAMTDNFGWKRYNNRRRNGPQE